MYKALQKIALRMREEQNCAATFFSHTNLENIHYIPHDKRNKRQIEKGWESLQRNVAFIFLISCQTIEWLSESFFNVLFSPAIYGLISNYPQLLLHSLPFLPDFFPQDSYQNIHIRKILYNSLYPPSTESQLTYEGAHIQKNETPCLVTRRHQKESISSDQGV